MKEEIFFKDIDTKTLDVDAKSRRVKNALNKVGVMDSDKDIIEENAFNKTIKERGPKGKNLIWHLTDHMPRISTNAIAKFSEVYMDKPTGYLVGITDIPNTTLGNDILELYDTGNINQHSIGFSTIKRDIVNEDDLDKRYQIIREVKLYEGSTVLWGANEDTPNLGKGIVEDVQSAVEKYLENIESIASFMRNGKASDFAFELMEYRMLQLRTEAKNLFESINNIKKVTPPAESSVADKDIKFVETVHLLNLKLQQFLS